MGCGGRESLFTILGGLQPPVRNRHHLFSSVEKATIRFNLFLTLPLIFLAAKQMGNFCFVFPVFSCFAAKFVGPYPHKQVRLIPMPYSKLNESVIFLNCPLTVSFERFMSQTIGMNTEKFGMTLSLRFSEFLPISFIKQIFYFFFLSNTFENQRNLVSDIF